MRKWVIFSCSKSKVSYTLLLKMASCSRKRYLLKMMPLLYLHISQLIDETWHGLPGDVTNRSLQVTPQILVLDILKLYVNSSFRRRNPRPSNSASPVAWKWVEVVFMIITAFRWEQRDQRPHIRTVEHCLSPPLPCPPSEHIIYCPMKDYVIIWLIST